MEKKDNSQQPTKSAVAAVAAGVLVIIAGFIMYNYFAKTGGEITEKSEQTEVFEESKNQVELTKPEDTVKGTKPATQTELKGTAQNQEQTTVWRANQYKSGDIKGSKYTVVRGDTLWQIAQARYGNPLMWTKILNANSASIGFLANGNPLITPGQVLILPD